MSVIRTVVGGGQIFHCPGCESEHAVNTNGPRWAYNGDADKPTFSPSILEKYRHLGGPDESKDDVCHSFVRDGRIHFLNDCTHELAGQTVDLPEWPYSPGAYGGIEDDAPGADGGHNESS